ncbi:pilus assembly protein PilX [Diaphorobacter sp. HDW4A]|uniref:pilus assembly PilX family protein n=1 Tax=Diaphorobacter sp. HDW4A TaxID=2714924 RepID=UPI00140DE4A8|nr:pilus assembly protein PilX [Diaphorobacter sp. HDW4A]QIL82682.1 pilus assembly protein PilX [Diaphorobacter sp. HDW4A]
MQWPDKIQRQQIDRFGKAAFPYSFAWEMKMSSHQKSHPIGRETGVALYVVIIIVLMISLLSIWAARIAFFHEILTSNEADHQKTFEAAQILMKDAELDIRHMLASGALCPMTSSDGNICRVSAPVHFPVDRGEMVDLVTYLDTLPTGCALGICRKRPGIQDFWSDAVLLLNMTATNVGARYGQFTGAVSGPGGNPVLAINETAKNAKDLKGAWYWIEVLPFADAQIGLLSSYENNPHLKTYAPDSRQPWIYRITVFAKGRKNGTEVVLQSLISLQSSE